MKKIILCALFVLLIVPNITLANNGERPGATVEVVRCQETSEVVGRRIFVPGKQPAKNGNEDNPAANNPIEVAGV